MDVIKTFSSPSNKPIICIETHTAGEPTRIIVKGYPNLTGTLLEQRAQAQSQHDDIRTRLLLEPRGHFDMYGAILRSETELTKSGKADIGVLFLTNEGYSTMCGHASIALGRFLLDTQDTNFFPKRREVVVDASTKTALLRLHAPCGIVPITVPINAEGTASDPTKPVSFLSTPSFATGLEIEIPVPVSLRWPELGTRISVTADFAYGGCFYCLVSARELGFVHGLVRVDLEAVDRATKLLKAAIVSNPKLTYLSTHPELPDMSSLYGIIVGDEWLRSVNDDAVGAETGICYFAGQSVDRSPCGSGVAARMAVKYAKRNIKLDQSWTFHSMVTNARDAKGFQGTIVEEVEKVSLDSQFPTVVVKVGGYAFYTGTHVFGVEDSDQLGNEGFLFDGLGS